MFEIKNINSGYNGLTILFDVSLEIIESHCTLVLGSNGAGKTTLLRTISGLVRPYSGQIIYNSCNIIDLPIYSIVQRGISHVPEGRRIFSKLTVLDNLLIGSYIKKARKSRNERLRMCFDLFPRLEERKNLPGTSLSGGEQQMLAIARALMCDPKVLMLDEPSLGLAPIIVSEIYQAINRLKEEGLTILLVEQSAKRALSLADEVVVLQNGHIVLSGTTNEISSDSLVKAYVGI